MDGRRGANWVQPTASGAPPLVRTGTLLGPLLLIPFLVQIDSCLVRKEWYQFNAFALALVVLLALCAVTCRSYQRELGVVLRESQMLIALFVALAVAALFGATLPDAYLADGAKYVFYPTADAVLFTLAVVAAVLCRYDSTWRLASAGAMGLMVTSVVWDSLYPGTFSELTTRAAGFGVNPNTGAAIIGLLLIGQLNWKRGGMHPFALATLAISGLGVFLTLSRSGLLCWGLVAGLYLIKSLYVRGASAWLACLMIAAPIGVYAASAGEWAREAFPMLQESHQRIEAFLGGEEMDHTDDSRVHIAEEFFAMAMERPWIGWGTGLNYASEEGAHNIYLAKWVENGLFALVAVLTLIGATFYHGRRHRSTEVQVLAAYVFAQGFFSHNMFEDKTLLLTWGILCGRAALSSQPASEPSAVQTRSFRTGGRPSVVRDRRRRIGLPADAA